MSALVSLAVAQQLDLAKFDVKDGFHQVDLEYLDVPSAQVAHSNLSAKFASVRRKFGPDGPTGFPADLNVSDRDDGTTSVPVRTLTVPDDDELRQLQASRQDTSGTLKYLQNGQHVSQVARQLHGGVESGPGESRQVFSNLKMKVCTQTGE